MAGFEAVTVKSTPAGSVDLNDLRAKIDDRLAVFMITNPSTLGLFERQVREIAETKLKDTNAVDIDDAIKQVEGTARSMGIVVEG